MNPTSRHLLRAARAVGAYVRSAPGTYLWLAVLFGTTIVMHRMSPDRVDDFLRLRSTNIHNLSREPVRALVRSALWIDGGKWLPYVVLYTVFHATAERWLGTWRWLAVVLIGHVLATYISEGALLWAIRHGHAQPSDADTLDVGVSYGLAVVEAVLVYAVVPPWRYAYAGGLLFFYGLALAESRTFTDIGHFTSVLLGFTCYPLTRGRPGRIDPAVAYRRLRHRRLKHR